MKTTTTTKNDSFVLIFFSRMQVDDDDALAGGNVARATGRLKRSRVRWWRSTIDRGGTRR